VTRVPVVPDRSGLRRSVAEVASLIDEYGETHLGNACLNKRADSAHIFSHAVQAPDHNGKLARQRGELGPAMRGFVLEFCCDQDFFARVTDHEVGAERPPGTWQQRIIVKYLVRQGALTDHRA